MYIPDYNLDPPEFKADYHCQCCHDDLVGDDVLFEYEGRYICYDCFLKAALSDSAYDIIDVSTGTARELARAIGVDTWTVEELLSA